MYRNDGSDAYFEPTSKRRKGFPLARRRSSGATASSAGSRAVDARAHPVSGQWHRPVPLSPNVAPGTARKSHRYESPASVSRSTP